VASEKVARHQDPADNRFGKVTGPELVGHHRGDFVPKVRAELFMDALVADDRKLLGAWGEIKQDGVAILSRAHPELLETACRATDDVIGAHMASGDKHADLARGPAFRLLNRLNNRSLVELVEKVVSSHCCPTIFRWRLHHQSSHRRR
jgi:hypothetical protein